MGVYIWGINYLPTSRSSSNKLESFHYFIPLALALIVGSDKLVLNYNVKFSLALMLHSVCVWYSEINDKQPHQAFQHLK